MRCILYITDDYGVLLGSNYCSDLFWELLCNKFGITTNKDILLPCQINRDNFDKCNDYTLEDSMDWESFLKYVTEKLIVHLKRRKQGQVTLMNNNVTWDDDKHIPMQRLSWQFQGKCIYFLVTNLPPLLS